MWLLDIFHLDSELRCLSRQKEASLNKAICISPWKWTNLFEYRHWIIHDLCLLSWAKNYLPTLLFDSSVIPNLIFIVSPFSCSKTLAYFFVENSVQVLQFQICSRWFLNFCSHKAKHFWGFSKKILEFIEK